MITNKHLKYNILGLGVPARYMSNEDGVEKDGMTAVQLQEKIPQQLYYACVYLANHLEVANLEDADLINGLEKFVDEHTLHWFEVLSLIGHLDMAHRAIPVVLKCLKSTSSDLHQLLSDALRFISKFYAVINRSALHTYYSALPFSPTDSLLYRRYIKEAGDDILCGIEGGLKKWDALVANLNHGEEVDAIKFSPDSVLFVSCSMEHGSNYDKAKKGELKIWDAATGIPISSIPGHRFAFTNDFSTIASSVDNVITYYHMDGSARRTMFTTSSKIEELALSESSRIAAALSDGTVWLWESRNGDLIDSFDGFGGPNPFGSILEFTPRLQFSPTGTRLAYSSANGIVKLRNGISGRSIADLRCGRSHKFKFSGDGSRIASLSSDGELALWSAESGGLVAVRDSGRLTDVLAISANGSLLATANIFQVALWDHLAKIEVLAGGFTASMALSPDNILAIGDRFSGITLYNTDTHSFISTLPFGGRSVAFSPDCTHIACGQTRDRDGNVGLWNMHGIDDTGPSSNLKATGVTMALSRDCSRLACGFGDGRVELWETSPINRRIALHQPLGERIVVVRFAPNGRLLASRSYDGTTKLWNVGDGSLHGTLKASGGLGEVALSNSALIAAGVSDVTLWSLDTLCLIHTFRISPGMPMVSISDESDLAAIGFDCKSVYLVDVINRTTIATFTIDFSIHKLSFLSDKSRLIVQTKSGAFLSLNLINHSITNGPTLEHLIQLPDIPLWHGVPVWPCWADQQYYIAALFSQHQTPVPVLWIPSDIPVYKWNSWSPWTQGSSMIALGCDDGRIILLRLPTSCPE